MISVVVVNDRTGRLVVLGFRVVVGLCLVVLGRLVVVGLRLVVLGRLVVVGLGVFLALFLNPMSLPRIIENFCVNVIFS